MISLLSTLSKVIEHCVHNRMTSFADTCFATTQCGSRKKHSPLNAVHLLFEHAPKAAKTGLFATALFLNVQGAFNKVLHP